MTDKKVPIIDASKIHILQIKTLKGNIDSQAEYQPEEIENHQFGFELGTGLDTTQKVIGFKLVVNIQALGKNDAVLQVEGSYTHEIIFRVDNLEEYITMKDEKELIDLGLGSTLVGIAYSTVRGIIFSRTQGTALGVVILPVIPPFKLMGIDTSPGGQSDRVENEKTAGQTDKKPRQAAKTKK